MDWVIGNTFPAVSFGVFGAYFLSFGATIVPSFGAYEAYATDPSNPATGLTALGCLSGIAFWNLMMAIFTIYCPICALRVNILFTLAFFFLALTLILISASYWVIADSGLTSMARNLQLEHAGGSTGFVVMIIGWYLLVALMLTTVDLPINLPVGDLSQKIPSGTELPKRKQKKDVEKNE